MKRLKFFGVFTQPETLSQQTLSHYLILCEYGFASFICKKYSSSFLCDIIEFWNSLFKDLSQHHAQVQLMHWSLSCFLRRFFGDSTYPDSPFVANLLPSILNDSSAILATDKTQLLKISHYFIEDLTKCFAEKFSSDDILIFLNDIWKDHKLSTYQIGEFLGIFPDFSLYFDYNYLYSYKCLDFKGTSDFFEGLLTNLSSNGDHLTITNNKSSVFLVDPTDSHLSFIQLVYLKHKHFVDIDKLLLISIFPSFGIVLFLTELEFLSIDQISDKLDKLPPHPIVNRFTLQLKLCKNVKNVYVWRDLKKFSIPKILQNSSIPFSVLRNFPKGSRFIDISVDDWNKDFDFLSYYFVFYDILNHNVIVDIPEVILGDVFSLLFLQHESLKKEKESEEKNEKMNKNGNEKESNKNFVFYPGEALEIIHLMLINCSKNNPIRPFLEVALNRLSIICEIYDYPSISDALEPVRTIYEKLVLDRKDRIHILRGINKLNNLSQFVCSALFQYELFSNFYLKKNSISFNEIEMFINNKKQSIYLEPKEQRRLVALLDYFGSYHEKFVQTDVFNLVEEERKCGNDFYYILKDFVFLRNSAKYEKYLFSGMNSVFEIFDISNFNQQWSKFYSGLEIMIKQFPSKYRSCSIISFLKNIIRFLKSAKNSIIDNQNFNNSNLTASTLLMADNVFIVSNCMNKADSLADVLTYTNQAGLDFFEILFSSFQKFTIPKHIFNELCMSQPLPMLIGSSGKIKNMTLYIKSLVMHRWMSYCITDMKSYQLMDSQSAMIYLTQSLSLYNIKTVDNTYLLCALPIIIDTLSQKDEMDDTECKSFEDLLYYYFDYFKESWSSVSLICQKVGRRLFEEFAAMIPLNRRELLLMFDNSKDKNIKRVSKIFSKLTDFVLIRRKPAFLLFLLNEKKIVMQFPEIVYRLCNIHLSFYGYNSYINNSFLCMKMILSIKKSDRTKEIWEIAIKFNPALLLYEIAILYNLDFAINISKSVGDVDCSEYIRNLVIENPKFFELLSEKPRNYLLSYKIKQIKVNNWTTQQKWLLFLTRCKKYATFDESKALLNLGSFLIRNNCFDTFDFSDFVELRRQCQLKDYHFALEQLEILKIKCEEIPLNFYYINSDKNHYFNDKVSLLFKSPDVGHLRLDFSPKYKTNSGFPPIFDVLYRFPHIRVYMHSMKKNKFVLPPPKFNFSSDLTKDLSIAFGYNILPLLFEGLINLKRSAVIYALLNDCIFNQHFFIASEILNYLRTSPEKAMVLDLNKKITNNNTPNNKSLKISHNKEYSDDICNNNNNNSNDNKYIFNSNHDDNNNKSDNYYYENEKKCDFLNESLIVFADLLYQIASSAANLNINSQHLLPVELIQNGTLEDIQDLLSLHQLQSRIPDFSLFDEELREDKSKIITLLLHRNKYEIAFGVAKCLKQNVSSIIFQYANQTKAELGPFLLHIFPLLDENQFNCVIRALAPILSETENEPMKFVRLLLCGITNKNRIFKILIWFEKLEEAFIFATKNKEFDQVKEIRDLCRNLKEKKLENKCDRWLHSYQIKD